ncbi:MAG: hypothetical protein Q9O62_13355 [Ardenticatenia bacterium]|nr:hypothetical protein [Ardenticatenia bacterium]
MRLAWRAERPLKRLYTFFVHLVGPDGQLVAQHDRPPEGGFYPTTAWDPGEVVQDTYVLEVPKDVLPGVYRLIAGAYWLPAGERLRAADGSDAVELTTLVVTDDE